MSNTSPVQPDPSVIGGVAKAPFVRLPDPVGVFARRAARLRALAGSGELGPYLALLADIADAQAAIVPVLPEASSPTPDVLERARQFAMPPLDRATLEPNAPLRETCRRLFDALAPAPKPEAA